MSKSLLDLFHTLMSKVIYFGHSYFGTWNSIAMPDSRCYTLLALAIDG